MPKFNITGMRCGGCSGRVKRLIEELLPGADVDIDLSSGAVRVEHPAIEPAAVIRAVSDAGFGAELA
ncbi:MAG TPA: heavy metal-associated domain-containing protein [Candidatus Sulfotelmatobacter sp.]|jgi:copper chaperone|nr:heavy metal-associated domain-containing protein [Candidatus Sulfotelmatobacter sp.]